MPILLYYYCYSIEFSSWLIACAHQLLRVGDPWGSKRNAVLSMSKLKRCGGGSGGGVSCEEAEWVRPSAAHGGARRRTSLVNLVDHVANGLVIESRPTAVGENFQVVCTSLKTTDDYEEGVKFHSAIAAVKMAASAASSAPPPLQWRRRRHRLRWWLRRLRLR